MRLTFLTSFATVIALTNPGTAFAGSTPRSDEHAKTSLTTGFSVKSLPVLKWRSPRSPEATLNVLLRSLPGKTDAPYKILRQQNDPVLRVAAQEWRLDIFGSGSAAEYLNEGNAGRALRTAVEPSQAMRLAQLERSGRDYIAQGLAGVITLTPGDSLTSEAMSARVMGGSAIDGSSSYSTVLANRMIFTREIEGVPVVGAGSKVAVTFLNDGSIEFFPLRLAGVRAHTANPIPFRRRGNPKAGADCNLQTGGWSWDEIGRVAAACSPGWAGGSWWKFPPREACLRLL